MASATTLILNAKIIQPMGANYGALLKDYKQVVQDHFALSQKYKAVAEKYRDTSNDCLNVATEYLNFVEKFSSPSQSNASATSQNPPLYFYKCMIDGKPMLISNNEMGTYSEALRAVIAKNCKLQISSP